MTTPSPSPNKQPSAPLSQDDFMKQYLESIKGITGQAASANAGKLTDTSKIYMGTLYGGSALYQTPTNGPYAQTTNNGMLQKYNQSQTYGELKTAPTTWDANTLKKFVNTGIMRNVKGFDVGMGMPEIMAAWDDMLQSSWAMNVNAKEGDKQWTPWDVLNSYGNSSNKFGTITKDGWQYDVATGERIKYVGKTTKTTTSKNIDLSNPGQVKAIVTDSLRQLLGRAPTDKELAQYRASINGYENSNPAVSTTTQTLTPDITTGTVDVTGQNTVTAGGVTDADRQQLISDQATQTKEYGKYQAATTYWNAMMQMIAGG